MWRTKPTDFVTKVGKKFKLLYKPHNYGTRWRKKPIDFVTKMGKQINAKIKKLLLILACTIFPMLTYYKIIKTLPMLTYYKIIPHRGADIQWTQKEVLGA
jgi:hypothetical protein